MSLTNEHELYS